MPSATPLALALFLVPVAVAPFFHSPFEAPKWLVIYLLVGVWLLLRRDFYRPLLGFLIFPGTVLLTHFLVGIPVLWREQFLLWFGAWVVFFAGYEAADLRKLLMPTVLALAVVTGIGLLQAKGLNLISFVPAGAYPDSTFGYPNITAEFVGAALLVLAVAAPPSRIVTGLGSSALFYLSLLSCRAVLLGLVCGWGFTQKKYSGRVLGFVFIFALFCGLYRAQLGAKVTGEFWENKSRNVSSRLIRWGNTWNLIKDHPWGVGLGNFKRAYPAYNHSYAADPELENEFVPINPHNHYLEALAEMGWIPALLCFSVALWFFARIFWWPVDSMERRWVLSQMAYVAVVGLFAFPLQQPFIYLLAALTLGHAAKNFPVGHRNLFNVPAHLFGGLFHSRRGFLK